MKEFNVKVKRHLESIYRDGLQLCNRQLKEKAQVQKFSREIVCEMFDQLDQIIQEIEMKKYRFAA